MILNDERRKWRELTPRDLQKISVGPGTISFGHVTLKSIAKRNIEISNSLEEDILFQIDLEKEEFGHTSPVEIIVRVQKI